MKPFRAIAAEDLGTVDLKSEMGTYGYVFVRGLLPMAEWMRCSMRCLALRR